MAASNPHQGTRGSTTHGMPHACPAGGMARLTREMAHPAPEMVRERDGVLAPQDGVPAREPPDG